jgi:hypothetical protein
VSFTVSARVSAHRFSYRHASLLSALEQGLSLLTAGVSDVQVVDGDGHARCPAAVYKHSSAHAWPPTYRSVI